MKKEVMEKWVAALRSGEYKQAKEQLKTREGFCCLGVLCEVMIKESDPLFKYKATDGVLPAQVQFWAGMTSSEGHFFQTDKLCLWKLNDEQNKSFVELADIIEKSYEEL